MSTMFIASWGIWFINQATTIYNKSLKAAKDIYTVLTTDEVWLINAEGQYAYRSTLISPNNDSLWVFTKNKLSKGPEALNNKFPYLSCEFVYNENTVSMDDFIEDVRFNTDVNTVPFPVIMAAFSIYTKKLYSWSEASFSAFTRTASQVEFLGTVQKLPME